MTEYSRQVLSTEIMHLACLKVILTKNTLKENPRPSIIVDWSTINLLAAL